MTDIRAFVGHSFTSADEAVVGAFIKYFEQVAQLLPSFQWVHAQKAEPSELAVKVRRLISDRNVFIGICTKKERVVGSDKLRSPWWSRAMLAGRVEDFEWKTSDWVIQEIGLAIGREMSLVLLLENGCRKPGGLQGDVEFIPFDRSAPEKAFGPLLEMLRALSPPARVPEAALTEGRREAEKEVAPPPAPTDDDMPDGSWERERYVSSFAWRLMINGTDAAAEIDTAYRQIIEGNEVGAAEWQAITEGWRIRTSRGGSLTLLKELHKQFSDNPVVAENLAFAWSKFGNNLEAASAYIEAANAVLDDRMESEKLRGLAAVQYIQAGHPDLAEPILETQREWIAGDVEREIAFLTTLRVIAEITKDVDLEIEVMERILSLNPDDIHTRFSLAYMHSNRGDNDLALNHYLKIPSGQRTAMAWNNLGVSFQQFNMPAKSIAAFQRSAAEGETLAMSNLGYKLMQAGFVDEAQNEFEKALKIENFHKSVGEGIATLRGISDEEFEKEKEVLQKSAKKLSFLQTLGLAITMPRTTLPKALWRGPDCNLTVVIENDIFSAIGEYDRHPNALGVLLMASPKANRYRIEILGRVVGTRIDGTVRHVVVGGETPRSLLGDDDGRFKISLNVDSTNGTIFVMESTGANSVKFYEINRL